MNFTVFKRNYYCLVAGLPDILIDERKVSDSSLVLKNELNDQLHPSDYKLVKLLYLQYDTKNVLNILLKQNLTHLQLANYSNEYLEEQIKEPTTIHDYLKHFIIVFKKESFDKSIVNSEKELLSFYYKHMLQTKNNFLKKWFRFELNMKNILTAVNSRKYGFDIEKQLISISKENEVYNTLLTATSKTEVLIDEVPNADKIIKVAESDMSISKKEKAYDAIKWKFLDDNTVFNYFNIEKILSFVIKLNIIERWLIHDDKTGKALFEKLLNDIKTNYKFTDEFSA